MLIAMAGLPATGKSTIAAHLAQELDGVVLSKDQVRAVLFPSPVLDYSTDENQISMDAIFQAASLMRGKPEVWACAILRVIGWVNFLDDSSQKLHMKLTAIDMAFGVAEHRPGQGEGHPGAAHDPDL